MNSMFFRFAAGATLLVAAAVSLAGAPADRPSYLQPPSVDVESPRPDDVSPASVTEELFVYGTAAVPGVEHERLKAAIREQARVLSERLKASIEIGLKRLALPKLKVASGPARPEIESPTA